MQGTSVQLLALRNPKHLLSYLVIKLLLTQILQLNGRNRSVKMTQFIRAPRKRVIGGEDDTIHNCINKSRRLSILYESPPKTESFESSCILETTTETFEVDINISFNFCNRSMTETVSGIPQKFHKLKS